MSETALKEALVDRYDRDKYVFADKMPTVLIKSGDVCGRRSSPAAP